MAAPGHDPGRLSQVDVLADLPQHEGRQVGPGNPRDGRVRGCRRRASIRSSAPGVGESRRPGDRPVADDSPLDFVVGDDVAPKERGEEPPAKDAELRTGLVDREERQAHQSADAVTLRRGHDVRHPLGERRVASEGCRGSERADHRVLAFDGGPDGVRVAHVSADDRQPPCAARERGGAPDEGGHLVSPLQGVGDQLATGRSTGPEHDDLP
jgi:hypothetical protein